MRFERWFYTIPLRLRSLFRRRQVERELDDELHYHLDRQIQEHLAKGDSPADARARALRTMAGVEQRKEECRDMRRVNWIESFLQDLRYAVRMLRRSPAFTLVAVLSLALGIGANAAIFTFINAIFLRTLPIANPHEVVQLKVQQGLLSFPVYRDIRQRQQVFTDVFASVSGPPPTRITIPGRDGAPAELDNMRVYPVTNNYFNVLGVTPLLGRFFTEDDERIPDSSESAGSVVVLSEDLWARQFGRSPDVLNRTILIGHSACRIIGVAPPNFFGHILGRASAAWIPLVPFFTSDDLDNRRGVFTEEMARLRPGVTVGQAESAMTTLYRQLRQDEGAAPDSIQKSRMILEAADAGFDSGLRETYSKPLWIVMGIVGFVLLIACANVANLLLARAGSRRAEIGVRLAIGCSRARLVCQLLTESVLLSLLGAAGGAGIAWWGSRALLRIVETVPGTIQLNLNPDATVLTFLVGAGILTGLGFGLIPALRATKIDVSPALKTAGRGQSGRGRQRLSRGLAVLQVALSLVLLVGSGLLIRSFRNLHQTDLGFRPEHVMVFDLVHNPQQREPAALGQAADRVWRRMKQLPGIESASVSGILLFSGSDIGTPLTIPAYTPAPNEAVMARFNTVSPDYFETVGMTVVEGRGIEERDGPAAPPIAVVNEAMARRFFNGHAAGAVMSIAFPALRGKLVQIAGVVRDSKYNDLRKDTQPMFYMPITQLPRTLRSIEVRTRGPLASITASVRQAVSETTKDVMIRRVVTLSEQVDQSLAAERLMMRLCVTFGGLALLLACVGLYGVVSYAVTQRTNEIGIRMTLGATRAAVLWMVLGETLMVVTAGIVLGIALSLASTRLLTSFLYGLNATDTATIALATVVLLSAAILAAYLPARRASKVDPMTALRYE